MVAIIEIKIGKKKELLTFVFDKYSFSITGDISKGSNYYGEFNGVVCSGYFYNKKEMVIDYHKKEFIFFLDEIKINAEKIIKKSQILK